MRGVYPRGLGVAWSAVKLDFDFEVPVWRKSSKTSNNCPFLRKFQNWEVFGLFLQTITSESKLDFTALLATPRPLDRHATSLCCNRFYFLLYKGEFGNCQYQNQQKECSDYIDYLLNFYQYYICNQEMYSITFFRIMMVIRGGLLAHDASRWCSCHNSQPDRGCSDRDVWTGLGSNLCPIGHMCFSSEWPLIWLFRLLGWENMLHYFQYILSSLNWENILSPYSPVWTLMCLFRLLDWENAWPHSLHNCALTLMWNLRLQEWENVWSQSLHRCGFISVWTIMWLFRWHDWENVWSHSLHISVFSPDEHACDSSGCYIYWEHIWSHSLQEYGFSPVWTLIWILENVWSHPLQEWSFSPVWTMMDTNYIFKMPKNGPLHIYLNELLEKCLWYIILDTLYILKPFFLGGGANIFF